MSACPICNQLGCSFPCAMRQRDEAVAALAEMRDAYVRLTGSAKVLRGMRDGPPLQPFEMADQWNRFNLALDASAIVLSADLPRRAHDRLALLERVAEAADAYAHEVNPMSQPHPKTWRPLLRALDALTAGAAGFDRFAPSGEAETEQRCIGCSALLLTANFDGIADGCPCNSSRGINHGLVPKHTCTCEECDPAQTGSVRKLSEQPQAPEPSGSAITSPRSAGAAGSRDGAPPTGPDEAAPTFMRRHIACSIRDRDVYKHDDNCQHKSEDRMPDGEAHFASDEAAFLAAVRDLVRLTALLVLRDPRDLTRELAQRAIVKVEAALAAKGAK